jgi:hypothetical protein
VRRTASWAHAAAPPTQEHVLLGFVDGTEVELGPGDPTALALHAVADVLMREEHA